MASPDLNRALKQASALRDPAQRSVQIAAVLAEALQEVGQDPVLVGGAAVEFYTRGGYTTADIDMLAEGGEDLVEVMTRLGFEKFGKDFSHSSLKIYVEFPGRQLQATETAIRLRIGERSLRIISIEDLIVDRLAAFKYWQSAVDGVNAMKLLEVGGEDRARLLARVREEDVEDALRAVQAVREAVLRRKLSKTLANRLLETEMRKLKKTKSG